MARGNEGSESKRADTPQDIPSPHTLISLHSQGTKLLRSVPFTILNSLRRTSVRAHFSSRECPQKLLYLEADTILISEHDSNRPAVMIDSVFGQLHDKTQEILGARSCDERLEPRSWNCVCAGIGVEFDDDGPGGIRRKHIGWSPHPWSIGGAAGPDAAVSGPVRSKSLPRAAVRFWPERDECQKDSVIRITAAPCEHEVAGSRYRLSVRIASNCKERGRCSD